MKDSPPQEISVKDLLMNPWRVWVMKRLTTLVAMTAALSSVFSPSVFALDINISESKGKILVNQGASFLPYVAGTILRSGDKIFVGAASSATLAYANCQITVSTPQVLTVTESPLCSGGNNISLTGNVFITPTAAASPALRLNQLIANYSGQQSAATKQGNSNVARCLNTSVVRLKGLRNFLARNPGVDPTEMIDDASAQASACNRAPALQKAKAQMPQVVEPTPAPILVEAAPLPPAAIGGLGGTNMALIGAGAAVLVGGGFGAYLLLKKPVSQ
jgi:hypothetical protein